MSKSSKSQTSSTSSNTSTSGSSSPAKSTPTWRLNAQWAHYGERLEDAMREAMFAPGSRTMWRKGQGSEPTPWDIVSDLADILERADVPIFGG